MAHPDPPSVRPVRPAIGYVTLQPEPPSEYGEIQDEINLGVVEIDYEAETEPMEEEEHAPEPMVEIMPFFAGQLETINEGWLQDPQEEMWLQDPQEEIDDG